MGTMKKKRKKEVKGLKRNCGYTDFDCKYANV